MWDPFGISGWQGVIVTTPTEAYGIDANRILQDFMGAPVRNKQIDAELKVLFELIDSELFDEARAKIIELQIPLGEDEPELTRASSLIPTFSGAIIMRTIQKRKEPNSLIKYRKQTDAPTYEGYRDQTQTCAINSSFVNRVASAVTVSRASVQPRMV